MKRKGEYPVDSSPSIYCQKNVIPQFINYRNSSDRVQQFEKILSNKVFNNVSLSIHVLIVIVYAAVS